jgi:hypothetical protein
MGKIFVKHFGFIEDNEENRKLREKLTPSKNDTPTKKSTKKVRANVKRVSNTNTAEQLDDNLPIGAE